MHEGFPPAAKPRFDEGWRLWAVLAAVCLVATWVPMLVTFGSPVYAVTYWYVLSAYIGLSWLSPAALTGLAVSRISRVRSSSRPRLLPGLAGVCTGALLLCGIAVLLASVETPWTTEAADAPSPTTSETVVTPPPTPEDLVREVAKESRPVQSVRCHAISDESVFCAVTFVGPSCQLWVVTRGEPTGIASIIEGSSGSRSGTGVRCGT